MSVEQEEMWHLVSDAGQARFCPAPAMFLDESCADEIKRHLSWCEPCRKMIEDGEIEDCAALEELGGMIEASALSDSQPEAVKPGQIWQIDQDKGGWDEQGIFHHAPQVLILETCPGNVVRVAHISPFGGLAGQEDLRLESEPDSAFAEMWNVWSMPEAWLNVCLGAIEPRRIAAHHLLRELRPPQPIEEESPLALFRQQELFHSSRFALAAMDEVTELVEEAALQFNEVDAPQKSDVESEILEQPSSGGKLIKALRGVKERLSDFADDVWEFITSSATPQDLVVNATTAFRELAFETSLGNNICYLEWQDGKIGFNIEFIPSNITYGVQLLQGGKPINLKDENGSWRDLIEIDSDTTVECASTLTEDDFRRCEIRIFSRKRV